MLLPANNVMMGFQCKCLMWFIVGCYICHPVQEIMLKASSPVVQNQWYQKLKELLETLQPVFEPQRNGHHTSPVAQTAAVHANVMRVHSQEDERSSPLAKMTRIFEMQKDDTDEKPLPRTLKRKTL